MQRTPWIVAAAVAIATTLSAPGARAQLSSASSSPAPAVTPAATSGPTMDAAAIAPRFTLAPAKAGQANAASSDPRPFGIGATLMIVGGAALIAGAIIGGTAGTIMMIGGAGVGLYGLYLFLRTPSSARGSGAATGAEVGVGVGYRVATP